MTDIQKLYNTYAKDIYRFAYFLCGNSDDAEDITSETFARALISKTPINTETVKGYLLTIARNLHFENIRKKKRIVVLEENNHEHGGEVETAIGNKDELQALRTYLQNFPEQDRSALLMRGDGLSYSEIAEILGITVSSAKVKVHRLRLNITKWRTNINKIRSQNLRI